MQEISLAVIGLLVAISNMMTAFLAYQAKTHANAAAEQAAKSNDLVKSNTAAQADIADQLAVVQQTIENGQ